MHLCVRAAYFETTQNMFYLHYICYTGVKRVLLVRSFDSSAFDFLQLGKNDSNKAILYIRIAKNIIAE